MSFRQGFIIMAPDADPQKHRGKIKTPMLEISTVVCQLGNYDQALDVCRDMVEKEGVQSLILCPFYTHKEVARVTEAVGNKIPVNVARGDGPSVVTSGKILHEAGWF